MEMEMFCQQGMVPVVVKLLWRCNKANHPSVCLLSMLWKWYFESKPVLLAISTNGLWENSMKWSILRIRWSPKQVTKTPFSEISKKPLWLDLQPVDIKSRCVFVLVSCSLLWLHYSAALQTFVLMFIVLHINGHFSLLLVNMFLSLVAYDNLL